MPEAPGVEVEQTAIAMVGLLLLGYLIYALLRPERF